MKERPILFSAPMVRALLNGSKSQTRRAINPQPAVKDEFTTETMNAAWQEGWVPVKCPYGTPGDRLIVRENVWMWCEKRIEGTTPTGRPKVRYVPMREVAPVYAADHPAKPDDINPPKDTGTEQLWRLKLGRFMPRWASRLTLEITDIRVDRLQEISEADAMAEGIPAPGREHACDIARQKYRDLWSTINGPESWAANPWVWALSLKFPPQL